MKSEFLVLSIIGSVFIMTGCASSPIPEDASTKWTPPANAEKPDTVWSNLRGQKLDFSKPLTLAELTDIALKNNPASRKTWNEARAAAEQVTFARGYFMPEIKAIASESRQQTTASPEGFDSDYTKYGPGLQVNYLIINFGGGRKAAVEQALQTVYAADFNFNKSIQDILLAAEISYYSVISAKSGIEAADASVKDSQKTLEIAQERRKQGSATDLDVMRAQAGYDQSLYNLAGAQGLYKTARANLAQVIGVPADTEIQLAQPSGEIPESIITQDMRKLIDDSLNRRPDISALRAMLTAKQAAVKVASASFWPSLYFNGSVNRNYYDAATGKDMQENDTTFGGALSLQWTLFDGMQNTSEKRTAIALSESMEAQLQQAELAASADVWNKYNNYETSLQKYKFSTALLKSASASYDLALESYKGQLINILDLLNAETQLAQARALNTAARQDVFLTLANLAHSTGLLEKGGTSGLDEIFTAPIKKDN